MLSTTSPEQDAQAKIEQWEKQNKSRLARARRTLGEISRVSVTDLAELSVAAREIRIDDPLTRSVRPIRQTALAMTVERASVGSAVVGDGR